MYQYKIIPKSATKKWSKDLNIFYKKYYKNNYSTVFENTTLIGICLNDKKIIGAIRVISDLKRFALLVDLRVDAKYQNQGIATTLMRDMLKKLVSMEINHINLVVVQNSKWLNKFYKKLGFLNVTDSTLLQYKGNN